MHGRWKCSDTSAPVPGTEVTAASTATVRRAALGATAEPVVATVVSCGTVVAFDTARPGPDGLELRVDSGEGSPLTGVAYELAPAG